MVSILVCWIRTASFILQVLQSTRVSGRENSPIILTTSSGSSIFTTLDTYTESSIFYLRTHDSPFKYLRESCVIHPFKYLRESCVIHPFKYLCDSCVIHPFKYLRDSGKNFRLISGFSDSFLERQFVSIILWIHA
jgi:hypothetical protein